MEQSRPILSSLAVASFLIGLAINLSPASAQTDEQTQRELYDNNARFEQLSGAARTLLELKFGKKDISPGELTPGRTAATTPSAVEGDYVGNILVNDPNLDLTAQDTQSETTLVFLGPDGNNRSGCSAYNDSGSFIGGALKFTGFSRSTNGGASWTDKG